MKLNVKEFIKKIEANGYNCSQGTVACQECPIFLADCDHLDLDILCDDIQAGAATVRDMEHLENAGIKETGE